MSASWITAVGPWHWLLIAIVLMILEAFSPAAFSMELGWQVPAGTARRSQRVEYGIGKLQVDDATWKIRGPACGEGTQVRVTGVDDVVFLVTQADE